MSFGAAPLLHLDPLVAASLRLAWAEGVEARAEPCGYLLGIEAEDGVRVTHVRAGVNGHPQPERGFLLGPTEQLAVRREARAVGERVVGLWHGHLVGSAHPSRADTEGLGPLGPTLMLIAGREGLEPPRLRAWRWAGEAWSELALVIG